MKRITTLLTCLGLLFAASACFAQMYTITDIGTLGGRYCEATGINASGQVVGWSSTTGDAAVHAFRTAPNSPINPLTDDLGVSGGRHNLAVNDSGQVVGHSYDSIRGVSYAFRTAANSPFNPTTDDLGILGSSATGINASGQVVGGGPR